MYLGQIYKTNNRQVSGVDNGSWMCEVIIARSVGVRIPAHTDNKDEDPPNNQ